MSTTKPTHKYPSVPRHTKKKETSSKVENMYNRRENVSIQKRKESKIFGLKNFNNWIKSILILKYVNKGDTILDLCCGKGGDLAKFTNREIAHYVGVDIAKESLKHLVERYNEKSHPYTCKLIHCDATKKSFKNVLKQSEEFDCCSCQFALHYSFESEDQAKQLLENASNSLKQGGHFIVTTPDAYVLVKKLREAGKLKFGNSIYECTFEKNDFSIENGFFGLKYDFELLDAIDKCPEYLVHPDILESLAKSYHLDLVEALNFHDFYDKYVDDFDNLNQIYKIKSGKITKDEWDAIYLYKVYVFKKEGEKKVSQYVPQRNLHTKVTDSDIISL
eukprot:gene10555-3074_t